MSRKNSPGQAHLRSSKDLAGRGDTKCIHTSVFENINGKVIKDRCEAKGTVFRKWSWWCAEHDPGNVPTPTCRHDITSPLFGKETCSMCGYCLEGE